MSDDSDVDESTTTTTTSAQEAVDVGLLEELCEAMDATFARLVLRYPPRTAARRAAMPPCRGWRDGQAEEPQPPDASLGGGPKPRVADFTEATDRMAAVVPRYFATPETERPPLSNEAHADLEALAQRAVDALTRSDTLDHHHHHHHHHQTSWDAARPEDVAAAIRELSWASSETEAAEASQAYLDSARALRRLDDLLRRGGAQTRV